MSKVQVTLKSKSLLYRKDTCLILTDFDDFQYFKRPLGFEKNPRHDMGQTNQQAIWSHR